jgi:hypothetical protein
MTAKRYTDFNNNQTMLSTVPNTKTEARISFTGEAVIEAGQADESVVSRRVIGC